MAASTMVATVFPLGLRMSSAQTTIPSLPVSFTAIFPLGLRMSSVALSLSSSSSISGTRPLSLSRDSIIGFPVWRNHLPLRIECIKGYKMKTHKALAKRFWVSGSGKIMRRTAWKQHLLRKKNTKRRNRLSKMVQVDRNDYNNVTGALLYLKVNRAN